MSQDLPVVQPRPSGKCTLELVTDRRQDARANAPETGHSTDGADRGAIP